MELDVAPPVPPDKASALAAALERSGVDLAPEPDGYASAWLQEGLLEATGRDADGGGYALSPRRTRGATRA